MKRLFFVMPLSLLCLLFSCKDTTPAATNSTPSGDSTVTAQSDKNTANTKAVFLGIESGDLSRMNDIIATDAVDHTPMGDVKGIDSIKKMLGDMHNHVSNIKLELIADASNGDYHFVLEKMSGTVKDNFMGMQPNMVINDTSVGVEKIANGKVTDHWRFAGSQEMMKAMSMAKHPKK
jgi:SnoaL-like polyketide cyclase